MAEKKSTGLYAKMAAIMAQIDKVDKDAQMHAGALNYKYVTDTQVYHMVRKLMVEHGIALFASMVEARQERFITGEDKYGNPKDKYHTLAKFEFVLVDSETGDSMTCVWHGEADDSGDKGVNKSSTTALKYWLLKTFIIPTGDDPDDVPSGQRTAPARPAPNPRRIPETPPAPPAAPEPSELDAHLGPRKPRKGAKPEPAHTDELPPAAQDDATLWRASTAPLTQATWAEFQPWIAHNYPQVEGVNHAGGAVMKALREVGKVPPGDKPDWGAVFGKVTPGEVLDALDAHYAEPLAKAS